VVSRYRLLGYEDRDVADKDFRNDRVDGGEVGAGQSVTALYEVTRKAGASGGVATVRIRYQTADAARQPREQAQEVRNETFRSESDGSPRFRLAATVAEFAEVLKHTFWARGISLSDLQGQARERLGGGEDQQTRDLLALMQRAASQAPRSTAQP